MCTMLDVRVFVSCLMCESVCVDGVCMYAMLDICVPNLIWIVGILNSKLKKLLHTIQLFGT